MKIVGCYSYKGGTGRSTSAANLAASMALLGKNVLLVDLDIEGPGLSVILGQQDRSEAAIQDYLMSGEPSSFDCRKLIIDMKQVGAGSTAQDVWEGVAGNLYFIPARIGVDRSTIVVYSEDRIQKLLEFLFDKIAADSELSVDYVVVDSASGYGEMSAVAMAVSDLFLVFFRWSRQHLYGPAKIAKLFKFLVEDRGMGLDYQLVANCVPAPESDKRAEFMRDVRGYLEEAVGKPLFAALPENIEMKWDERLIVLEDAPETADLVASFRELAVKTVQHCENR